MKIANTLSNAAGVAVGPINASATVAAAGGGGQSVFAGVVFAAKGKPFSLLSLSPDNYLDVLGVAFKTGLGEASESIRCVRDALVGGNGYVVRVTPSAAVFPVLTAQAIDADSGLNPTISSAQSFGTPVAPSNILAIYPVDGDSSQRSISVVAAGEENAYVVTLFASDSAGTEYEVDSWEVSTDVDATDDYGYSLFITDVLENKKAPIASVVADGLEPISFSGIVKTPLIGASGGKFADLSPADWAKAIAVLSNAMVGFTAVVGLGVNNSTVIQGLVNLANSRHIDCFADIKATSYADAIAQAKGSAYNSHRLCQYFFPYTAKCPFYGTQGYWGISGLAFAAKAAGVARVDGSVGGWHYSPAGVERGIINRKEVREFDGLDEADGQALYNARINRVGLAITGQLMIDDAITTRVKSDYLLFQHISSTMDAISRDFYAIAKQHQHEPDDVMNEGLLKALTARLDDYVASGALVPPRNPEDDGEHPYVLSLTQKDIDYWVTNWACCVTGTSRRILGVPALLR